MVLTRMVSLLYLFLPVHLYCYRIEKSCCHTSDFKGACSTPNMSALSPTKYTVSHLWPCIAHLRFQCPVSTIQLPFFQTLMEKLTPLWYCPNVKFFREVSVTVGQGSLMLSSLLLFARFDLSYCIFQTWKLCIEKSCHFEYPVCGPVIKW